MSLAKRLREQCPGRARMAEGDEPCKKGAGECFYCEAADEIERLQQDLEMQLAVQDQNVLEIERLREALQEIVSVDENDQPTLWSPDYWSGTYDCAEIARKALEPQD